MKTAAIQLVCTLFLAILNGVLTLTYGGNQKAFVHPGISLAAALFCAFLAGMWFSNLARQFFKKD